MNTPTPAFRIQTPSAPRRNRAIRAPDANEIIRQQCRNALDASEGTEGREIEFSLQEGPAHIYGLRTTAAHFDALKRETDKVKIAVLYLTEKSKQMDARVVEAEQLSQRQAETIRRLNARFERIRIFARDSFDNATDPPTEEARRLVHRIVDMALMAQRPLDADAVPQT